MNFIVTMLLGFFAIALPPCTSASDLYHVTERDKKFLSEVVEAIIRRDAAWLAGRMNYPLTVVTEKGRRVVKNKEEFAAILNRGLTGKLVAKIAQDAKGRIFKNWQGVMIGDGILWFEEYQSGHAAVSEYVILALGHFAFQPEAVANPQCGTNGMQPFCLETNRASAAAASRR